jgi:hypothetical protein
MSEKIYKVRIDTWNSEEDSNYWELRVNEDRRDELVEQISRKEDLIIWPKDFPHKVLSKGYDIILYQAIEAIHVREYSLDDKEASND